MFGGAVLQRGSLEGGEAGRRRIIFVQPWFVVPHEPFMFTIMIELLHNSLCYCSFIFNVQGSQLYFLMF